MLLPRRPLRYAVGLFLIATVSVLYYSSRPTLSALSEDANPGIGKDANGNSKQPELATGVASVIDSHRGEAGPSFGFPEVIHQTAKKHLATPASFSWYYANPGEDHINYDDKAALAFVKKHSSSEIYEVYDTLNDVVARADLFRYIVLKHEGGVYADVDTTTLCPVSAWIPAEFSQKKINFVVGVEVDEPTVTDASELEQWGWASNFQFVQWVMMAKPDHPIIDGVISEVVKRVKALAAKREQSVRTLHMSSLDVIRTTGPGPFTDAVLKYLSLDNPSTLRRLTKPVLVKDVLVMPVTSFAPNQRHSRSKSVKYVENIPEVLVMHGFSATRSWSDDIKNWLHGKGY